MIEVTNFKGINSAGALQGTITLKLTTEYGSLVVRNCKYFIKGDSRWIAFPQKEYKNSEGKTQYIGHMFFEEKEYRELFNKDALEALDRYTKQKFDAAMEIKEQNKQENIDEDLPF